jgi:hypothetical protein
MNAIAFTVTPVSDSVRCMPSLSPALGIVDVLSAMKFPQILDVSYEFSVIANQGERKGSHISASAEMC